MASVVENSYNTLGKEKLSNSFILDFYKISNTTSISGKLKYGQGFYDFDEGGMFFFALNYLSRILKLLTGQSTQQHILIKKAKKLLSTTNLSISEIAYELGFEHSQSFSRLFKTKTNLSPLEFKQSFN